ncbi:LLM class flavin-dependent oxidoreductase [Actinoplanes xinjiangensis]|uniref:Luciferase-like monooxygenase n=1 Tax=Actinoplanes xinjiangensis TaxID=512350 RepID=A0A316ETX1_9ACTN|nr:LLM class flavin-dependent oxidoreductase [Actinoplanes xinjiangensis]PWK36094.1 luciferase-like monooxygenase [Actinoplanes xinjiangensis]GIF42902.1 LLM class F420-dependent oxidoreductase [Actinoplanes xinjiangensis]
MSEASPGVSFGFKTPQQSTSFDELVRLWAAGDAEPIWEHAWLYDHFQPVNADPAGPCLEAWTTLAALATHTRRLRVGVLVTGNTHRHPAVLASMLATVDHISGGRVDFGFGAAWHEAEHQRMGIDLPSPGVRLARWDEACTVVRRLCTEDEVWFDGVHYRLAGARLNPRPPRQPTFVLGATGRRALAVVARHADVWNAGTSQPAALRRGIAVLAERCTAAGRDIADVTISVQVPVVAADLGATRLWTERLIRAGARHIVLELPAPAGAALLPRLAAEVALPLSHTAPISLGSIR